MNKNWSVYLLQCADGTLYTGITNNLSKRLEAHNLGRGAKYTKGRGPVELVYHEESLTRGEALKRESQVKKLTRKAKLGLWLAVDK
ncbi:MAG TPA: GIY-YIG nuclease family protein [Candidatus Paceibacterota bacterium]|nr:GIY-YIG nuclease family protein [Candidatus Paceibacterota bacterium]